MKPEIYLEFDEWKDINSRLPREGYWTIKAKNVDDIPFGFDFEIAYALFQERRCDVSQELRYHN